MRAGHATTMIVLRKLESFCFSWTDLISWSYLISWFGYEFLSTIFLFQDLNLISRFSQHFRLSQHFSRSRFPRRPATTRYCTTYKCHMQVTPQTAGFTMFPSFVALVHKKLYVGHYLSCVGLARSPLADLWPDHIFLPCHFFKRERHTMMARGYGRFYRLWCCHPRCDRCRFITTPWVTPPMFGFVGIDGGARITCRSTNPIPAILCPTSTINRFGR